MEYFLYIIQSEKDGTFYVGSSAHPLKRLKKHNAPHKGYTSRKQPWKLVYQEPFGSKSQALERENFIKKLKSRNFLLDLTSGSSEG